MSVVTVNQHVVCDQHMLADGYLRADEDFNTETNVAVVSDSKFFRFESPQAHHTCSPERVTRSPSLITKLPKILGIFS